MYVTNSIKLILFALLIALLNACTDGDGGEPDPVDNESPVADAGGDQNVVVGTNVNLSGLNSSDDSNIDSYEWEQTGGTAVTLSSTDTPTTSFTADSTGTLEFTLTVTDDDGATDSDQVSVTVTLSPPPPPPGNNPPSADAGPDDIVDAGMIYTLDGSSSDDSDGAIVGYQWTQLSGTAVTLDDPSGALTSFTAPNNNGPLTFRLRVTDDDDAIGVDEVTITVQNGVVLTPGLDSRPDNNSCIAPASPGGTPAGLELVDVFPSLDLSAAQFPLGMYQLPNNDAYFYVINRDGRVLRFDNDPGATSTTEVLDFSDQVEFLGDNDGEGGFLAMAFHPQVASNGAVYFSYTSGNDASNNRCGGPECSIVSRYTMTDDATIDPNSEVIVLQVSQPFGNHNGGDLHFGPDGYLYFGLGDGGGSNDPEGNGQNTNTLHGSMLRIDVDPTTTTAPFYSIPPDNPFASGGGLPEIYAFGLRNPFRWSFDIATGVLWAGDVGQGAREEVDHIMNGRNYGWPDMEGNICNIGNCSSFEAPVHDYGRSVGISITGGYVYRGSDIPSLDGAYIFGDFVSQDVWTLTPGPSGLARTSVATAPSRIVSFAQDNDGEVYVLVLGGRTILKVQASTGGPPGSNIPNVLSDTGCFDPVIPIDPDDGLIPYDVVSPLWSDGAQKQRWMAIPNSATVDLDAQGDFDFPVGTILAKHFMNAGIMIETRLLMLHETGWAGYSYKWRDDQTDADLLQGADDDFVAGLDWHFPSGAECRACHTPVTNFALGPEVLQLNNDFTYPQTGRTVNQVFTLNSIGVFSAPPPANLDTATLFHINDGTATLEERVKSYLHTNCSQCHQPGGTGEGNIDLRFETPLVDMGICGVQPADDLGNPNARYIAPGSPGDSVILARMQASSASGIRMPPLATSLVDTDAETVFIDWINSLSGCP